MNLGQAVNKKAFGNRGCDRAKVLAKANGGWDIEFMGGDVARACFSHLPDLQIGSWVTAIQTGEGGWEIIGSASKAPQGEFPPEPPGP